VPVELAALRKLQQDRANLFAWSGNFRIAKLVNCIAFSRFPG
jgi:hypothetical protein